MNYATLKKEPLAFLDDEDLDYDTDPISADEIISVLSDCYKDLSIGKLDSTISLKLDTLLITLNKNPTTLWKEQNTIKNAANILRHIIVHSGNKNYTSTKYIAIQIVQKMIIT